MPDNTVIMPITIDNYISQMIDSMALDTGVQYLSLSFQTPNSDTTMVDDNNLKALEYLKNIIDNSLTKLEDENESRKILNNLFSFMTMFLIILNKNETIATLDKKEHETILKTEKICLNYVSVYLILLNLIPAFVTFSMSKNVLNNSVLQSKYGSIFNNIFYILKNSINIDREDTTSEDIEKLINEIYTPADSSDSSMEIVDEVETNKGIVEEPNTSLKSKRKEIDASSYEEQPTSSINPSSINPNKRRIKNFNNDSYTPTGSSMEIVDEVETNKGIVEEPNTSLKSKRKEIDASSYEEQPTSSINPSSINPNKRRINNLNNDSYTPTGSSMDIVDEDETNKENIENKNQIVPNTLSTLSSLTPPTTPPKKRERDNMATMEVIDNSSYEVQPSSKRSSNYYNSISTKTRGESLNFTGGSCNRINLRNPLLYIKFLFEWSHDFGPSTARAPGYVSGDYNYHDKFYDPPNGIFHIIKQGWEVLIKQSKEQYVDKNPDEDELDRHIFNELSVGKKHDEPTYISTIIDALMIYCKNIKEDFLYIPVIEFKFTTNDDTKNKTNEFFETVFKYFKDQRMFIKPGDTEKLVHLFITSDNTPIVDIPDDKPLGFFMPDMNIEEIAIALSNYRKSLYSSWDHDVIKPDVNIDSIVTNIFSTFKEKTGQIISSSKPQKYEIKTPARLIDPITTGGFVYLIKDNKKVISQSELNINQTFQEAIYFGTIYGINQLLNVWIDDKKVVTDYVLDSLIPGENKIVDKITFTTNNNSDNTFEWCVGDSTINVICGALINVSKNMGNYTFEQEIIDLKFFDKLTQTNPNSSNEIEKRWDRIYKITKQIIFHKNFRFQKPKISTVLMIISYLKSCGDEYQRLTCEFVNYLIDPNHLNEKYLLEYLPDMTELPKNLEKLKTDLLGTVYLLSKDRILIGESIEKNTPVYTLLQSPNEAFYDDIEIVDNFYEGAVGIKGSNINRKNTGILSNRRKELTTSADINYEFEIDKNTKNIINLTQKIFLKTTNIAISEKQKKLIKDKYIIHLPNDSENKEQINKIINEQNNKLELLTKISLALSYYSVENQNLGINKNIYEELINTEIFKAVSLTINSDLLEDIKLKNSCRIPRTIGALNTLINNTYDAPEVVDKLIESYEVANELFLQKIKTFKQILVEPTIKNEFENEFKTLNNTIDLDVIITDYNGYITYVNNNKNKFSDDIMKKVDSYLQAEIRKSERGNRGSRVSYTDTDEFQGRLNIVVDELFTASSKKQQLELEQNALQEEQKTQKQTSKNGLKIIKSKIKKGIKSAGDFIQKLTKKKQDLETKIASKTKIYGFDIYSSLVDRLKGRTFRSSSSSVGGKIHKSKKNKRKKCVTKKKMLKKKSIKRRNYKKRNTKHKL
jgi:hypothetical protein